MAGKEAVGGFVLREIRTGGLYLTETHVTRTQIHVTETTCEAGAKEWGCGWRRISSGWAQGPLDYGPGRAHEAGSG